MSETALHLVFKISDWFDLFAHYLSLSLLSIGGAISTAPDMHRFLVDGQWQDDQECSQRRPNGFGQQNCIRLVK